MMKKTGTGRLQKAAPTIPKSVWITPIVNRVNSKINRANAQSRISGILFASANGKLCFELLASFSAAQNRLPRRPSSGGEMRSEVAHLKVVKGRQKKSPQAFTQKQAGFYPKGGWLFKKARAANFKSRLAFLKS